MKIFAPLLIALLSSLPAHGALSSEEQKCVRAHHRALLKVAASQDAELRKCHSRAASAKLDGSIQACLAASEKVGRALEKAARKSAKQCGSAPAFGPSDAATTGAAAIAASLAASASAFGPNLDRSLALRSEGAVAASCQKKLLKAVQRCGAALRSEFDRCATQGIGGKTGPPGAALPFDVAADLALCGGHDPRGRAERRCIGPVAKAAATCADAGLGGLDSLLDCAVADPNEAARCIADRAAATACAAFASAGELPTDCAPADGARGSLLALSYNVAGLPEGISSSMPETFTPLISPLLNGYDLVVVQESWLTPDPNPLEPLRNYHELLEADAEHPYKSVPKPAPLGGDPFRPFAQISDGLNRFSHHPFEPVVRVAWAECFGDLGNGADCLALKGFSLGRTTLAPGVVVDVYNLHMEAGGSDEDDAVREGQVTQLVDFIAANSAGNPVIIGGDFNLHSDSPPDEAPFQALLDGAGLQDVCVAVGCPDTNRIDKFLFRSSDRVQLTPLSWTFETDVFVAPGGDPLSDHDPLAVEFVWQAVTGS